MVARGAPLPDPRVRVWAARLQFHAAAIGLISLAVLAFGWSGVFPWLISLGTDYPSMKAVTAAGLCALSAACLLSLRPETWAVRAAAGLGLLVAVWMAAQLFLRIGRPGDGLWSYAPSDATLVALMLVGLAFAVMPYSPRTMSAVVFALAVGVVGAALFRAFDLVLLGGAVLNESPFDTMAIHTALLVAWLSVACVLLHPRLGIRDVLVRASSRGRILRYALALIVALPFASYALAWVLAQVTGWSENSLFAATASLSVVGGAVLVWWYSLLVENLQAQTRAHVVQLTRANEALERYASMTAHDLKAPIRHIRVYSELTIEALSAGGADKVSAYAQSNIDSCDTLLASVDSLLSHARSAYTQLTLGEHSLSELLRAAGQLAQDDMARVPPSLSLAEDVRVSGDGHLIESVFQNLMSNSMKYCDPDELLKIRVGASRDGAFWRITFEDNGPGFEAAFIPVAFDHLSRGAPSEAEGSGIGLTICKTIMDNHGGGIEIDPDFKDGARIVLTLPVSPGARAMRRDWETDGQ